MEQLFETIEQLDKELLLYLQSQSAPWLDQIMATITETYAWIPLYLLLIMALFKQFSWQLIYSLIAVAIVITLSDQITSSLMKPLFGRFRPCHDPEIGHLVRIVTKCGGQFGFVSSHAANTFSVATFFILLFRKSHPYFWLLIFWPVVVSYSRIYLGVHYPMDVLGGAVVGSILGILVYISARRLSVVIPFVFTPERHA